MPAPLWHIGNHCLDWPLFHCSPRKANMKRLSAVTFLSVFIAVPGSAEALDATTSTGTFDIARLSAEPRLPPQSPVVTLRLVEQRERFGSTTRQRGVAVARDIGPNASVALGLLDMKPRKSGLSPDPQLDTSVRKSRKAAVRLTLRF